MVQNAQWNGLSMPCGSVLGACAFFMIWGNQMVFRWWIRCDWMCESWFFLLLYVLISLHYPSRCCGYCCCVFYSSYFSLAPVLFTLTLKSMVVSFELDCICWTCICRPDFNSNFVSRYIFSLSPCFLLCVCVKWAVSSIARRCVYLSERSLWFSTYFLFFQVKMQKIVECLCVYKYFQVPKNHQQIESLKEWWWWFIKVSDSVVQTGDLLLFR